MYLINCTPHAIDLIVNDGVKRIEPCGLVLRVETETHELTREYGFRLVEIVYGEIQGLPDEADDTLLIVSKACVEAAPWRKDLVYPADLVRDENGNVIACCALSR